jgi:hypothetical protein
MSYASAVKSVKSKPIKPINSKSYVMTPMESAYAFKCNAQWGDIASYDPKEDGSYEEFFLESGLKRHAVVKEITYEVEVDLERIREIVAKKEQLREQAKLRTEPQQTELQCKCGCGRAVHQTPSPEFIGYCCKWCKKHNGRRGHGESCGK